MPKISWAGADEDERLTAGDIDQAEDGYPEYMGDLPPGGVYRFGWHFAKYAEFGTGTQGLKIRLVLDGSWKPDHEQYNGCPLWDQIVMTKAAAGFAKAFAQALGVTSADLVSRVVVDEDGRVTKIGPKVIDGSIRLYVAVRHDTYEGTTRLKKAGGGYQIVDGRGLNAEASAKATTKASKTKSKGKKQTEEDPPF